MISPFSGGAPSTAPAAGHFAKTVDNSQSPDRNQRVTLARPADCPIRLWAVHAREVNPTRQHRPAQVARAHCPPRSNPAARMVRPALAHRGQLLDLQVRLQDRGPPAPDCRAPPARHRLAHPARDPPQPRSPRTARRTPLQRYSAAHPRRLPPRVPIPAIEQSRSGHAHRRTTRLSHPLRPTRTFGQTATIRSPPIRLRDPTHS